MTAQTNTAPQWYAVRVRSKFESNVSTVLEHKGVEKFLPTYRSRRKWADRVKTLDLPLFPGYVFCRIPLEERNVVLTTGGVVDIVSIGRVPAPISDAEIEAIRTVVQAPVHAEPWPFLKIGETVRIHSGYLAGLEGILIKVKNSWRLVISVTLLQRSVAVEIDAAYVTPLQ
jgi:transcription antitermination factor NusG